MTRIERYEQHEIDVFERVFPMEKLRIIESKGNKKLDPFVTLARFGFHVRDDELARNIVLAEISASRFGPQINMVDSEHGVKIYGRDIIPFLRAAMDIYLKTFDLWTDEKKQEFSQIFSR